ncbi:cysteine desulfurase [Bacillus sp. FJAT-25509]|uniref:aminotransferase class V-fold PLP-dependent enzyme n=1 Tax=Bacillus sp. FJAT-25509 TaxID=1712029 RepID=UPI0006F90DA1|nr:aminotransferase class V-fold PLP-dependent enzyme [Bacillus sp. FJAT-25509]KQL33520.1 cysteine desulfurase [Bacillus sp. FJAT-25509]
MLYLDNSATTPIHPEVKDAMLPYLLEEFGNPSSKYYTLAENAKNAVESSRQHIAKLLGCDSDEIIFTSGSTESNNMILKGIADYYGNSEKNHIVTSKTEHPSILEVCEYLQSKGFKITYLDVDQFGRINLNQLAEILKNETPLLVSLIWGNNELGSLNPMIDIQNLCREYNVFLHTDATQVVGKIEFSLEELSGINFLSCSAHKFHGPKGVGVTVLRKDDLGLPIPITPLLHGGGQEKNYRSGTLAVHNIVGMGKAAEITLKNFNANLDRLITLELELRDILNNKFGTSIIYNNDIEQKIPGILNVQFKGLNNEILVKKLAPFMAVSTGSACSSSKPSHVLQAIGLSLNEVRNTIRFSLNPTINVKDLEIFNNL